MPVKAVPENPAVRVEPVVYELLLDVHGSQPIKSSIQHVANTALLLGLKAMSQKEDAIAG